jgi:hypothetical protein
VDAIECRKLVFDELLARAKDKVAKEEKRRKRAREDFTDLLRDVRDIHADTTWEEAQPLLERMAEYKAVRPLLLADPCPLAFFGVSWMTRVHRGTSQVHGLMRLDVFNLQLSREECEDLFNAYVAKLKERKAREAERDNEDGGSEKHKVILLSSTAAMFERVM